jgi:hypothetical protein
MFATRAQAIAAATLGIIIGGFITVTVSAQADGNGERRTIPYSGYVDFDGDPVHASAIKFNFALFPCADRTQCAPLWVAKGSWGASWPGDEHVELPIFAGRFSVELGAEGQLELPDSIFYSAYDTLYLAVAIENRLLAGTQKIVPAFRAYTAIEAERFFVRSDLTVGGAVTVGTGLAVGADLNVAGDVNIDQHLTVAESLTVTEDVTIGGDLAIGGDLTVNGVLKVGKLTITGSGRTHPPCDASTKGHLYYNDHANTLFGCDGSSYKIVANLGVQGLPYSCLDQKRLNPASASGVYTIDPDGDGPNAPFDVYCDQVTDGGGWTVFQRRISDSDFHKTWVEYKNGFGAASGNHWLGNDRISDFTNRFPSELYVDVAYEDCWGMSPCNWTGIIAPSGVARYGTFAIANEEAKYELTLGAYLGGNAGNSLTSHHGMKFTTRDADNDMWAGGNCSNLHFGDLDWYPAASTALGGWWFANCRSANLNGQWLVAAVFFESTNTHPNGVWWGTLLSGVTFTGDRRGLRAARTEMKLRELTPP